MNKRIGGLFFLFRSVGKNPFNVFLAFRSNLDPIILSILHEQYIYLKTGHQYVVWSRTTLPSFGSQLKKPESKSDFVEDYFFPQGQQLSFQKTENKTGYPFVVLKPTQGLASLVLFNRSVKNVLSARSTSPLPQVLASQDASHHQSSRSYAPLS